MNDPNLPLLEAAVRLLQPLLNELVFVGGCATGLLITDPAAGGIRPTKDVMPTDEKILGFSNRWYEPAIGSAQDVEIAGLSIRLITAVYFLATKLEAFHGRGNDDYSGSHDLEDVVAVVDGRPETVEEVRDAPFEVRTYIASEIRQLLSTRAFVDGLTGFLLPDPASQERLPILRDRLNALAHSDGSR